jgi:hypothetical protein
MHNGIFGSKKVEKRDEDDEKDLTCCQKWANYIQFKKNPITMV